MNDQPSKELQTKRDRRAQVRGNEQQARERQLRVLSDAVTQYTPLPNVCSRIIAQYGRAASPRERTTITVDDFGDRQLAYCTFETANMGSVFESFERSLGGHRGCYYFYPEHYDKNLSSERIMPSELCFEYRNSTVFCRLRIDG
jgi:hypothetical protein